MLRTLDPTSFSSLATTSGGAVGMKCSKAKKFARPSYQALVTVCEVQPHHCTNPSSLHVSYPLAWLQFFSPGRSHLCQHSAFVRYVCRLQLTSRYNLPNSFCFVMPPSLSTQSQAQCTGPRGCVCVYFGAVLAVLDHCSHAYITRALCFFLTLRIP